MSSSSSGAERVLELKQRALELKQSGDVEGARKLLAAARDVELAGATVEALSDPAALRRLALKLKNDGDLEGAKKALLKAKAADAAAPGTGSTGAAAALQAPKTAAPLPASKAPVVGAAAFFPGAPVPAPAPVPASKPVVGAAASSQAAPPAYSSLAGKAFGGPAPASAAPRPAAASAAAPAAPALKAAPAANVAPAPAPAAPATARPPAAPAAAAAAAAGPGKAAKAAPAASSDDLLGKYAVMADGELGGDLEEEGELEGELEGEPAGSVGDVEADEAELGSAAGSTGSVGDPSHFTDAELLDVDSLVELLEVGMAIPGSQEYAERVQSKKKEALELKRAGDVEAAKTALRAAKNLEAAGTALAARLAAGAGDEEGDRELLAAELGSGGGGSDGGADGDEEGGGGGDDHSLGAEELADPDLLAEMISVGMANPRAETYLERSVAKKRDAMLAKKNGDLDGAKQALRESKLLAEQADNVTKAHAIAKTAAGADGDADGGADGDADGDADGEDGAAAASGAGDTDSDDDIARMERQIAAEAAGKPASRPAASKAAPAAAQSAAQAAAQAAALAAAQAAQAAPKGKSASEWKKEAVELKLRGELAGAAAAFREYKAAAALEEAAAARAALAKSVAEVAAEEALCAEQNRLLAYFELLGRPRGASSAAEVARAQRPRWRAYARQCAAARAALDKQLAEGPGGSPLVVRRVQAGGAERLLQVKSGAGGELSFVAGEADPADDRLLVAVVSAAALGLNKEVAKARAGKGAPQLHLQVRVTINLPATEQEPEGEIVRNVGAPVALPPAPASASAHTPEDDVVEIMASEAFQLPRGESRFARMVQRRMPRKRLEVELLLVPVAPPAAREDKKGLTGWLHGLAAGCDAPKEPGPEPLLVGKACVELKQLLDGTCVCGELPLLDKGGRREAGGVLALAVRTSAPYDPDAKTALPPQAVLLAHLPLTFEAPRELK